MPTLPTLRPGVPPRTVAGIPVPGSPQARSRWGSAATLLATLLLPATLLFPATLSAAESLVEVGGCHIQVIDRAVLASGQTGIVGTEVPREGTVVVKDAVVVALDDRVPAASLAMAQAQALNDAPVRSAEKTKLVAYKEWERAREANRQSKNAVSALEVDRLLLTAEESELKEVQAREEQKLAGLKRDEAAALLATYQVTAPFAGVVTRRFKNLGEAVRQGDPILEIVSVDRVRIEAEVPVAQRRLLKVGLPALIEPEADPAEGASSGGPRPQLEGRIVFIDLVAEPVSATVRVHVEVDNSEGVLLPGLYARMIVPVPAASAATSR